MGATNAASRSYLVNFLTYLPSEHLDSILILSQALPRVLALIIEELGEDGLGKLRSAYCENACAELERFITRCRAGLDSSIKVN